MLDGVRSIGEALMAADKTIAMAENVAGQMGGWLFEDSWVTQAKKDIANYIAALRRNLKQLKGDRSAPVPDAWSSQVRGDIMQLWAYAQLVQGEFPPESQTLLARVQDAIANAVEDLEYGLSQAPKLVAEAASDVAEVVGDVAGAAAGIVGNTAANLLSPLKWFLIGGGILIVGGVVTYLLLSGGARKAVP